MENNNSLRIDKWLWAVRIFKTRSLSTEACKAGKVKINGIAGKASREVKLDDIIMINLGPVEKTIKVLGILSNRVSAKLVPGFAEDLTPKENYENAEVIRRTKLIYRPKGLGRPTKKDRRDIENFNYDL
jgi:ribosome-associated heat shock protein Hsp15